MKLVVVALLLAGCISCQEGDRANSLSATDLLQKDQQELRAMLMSAFDIFATYDEELLFPPGRIPSDVKVDLVADILIRQIEIWRLVQKDHDRIEEIEQPSLTITTSLQTPRRTESGRPD